jgi:hypothetical protein
MPSGVALVSSFQASGIVYRGTLKRVEPIFVRSDVSLSRYGTAAGSAAELLAQTLDGNNKNIRLIANAAAAVAAAVTGHAEYLTQGKYCHYFIEVKSNELVESLRPSSNGDVLSEDRKIERLREMQRIREQIESMRPEESGLEVNYTREQIRKLREELKQVYQKVEDARIAPPARTISVVNPCRDFAVGIDVEISRFSDQIVLEEVSQPRSLVSPTAQPPLGASGDQTEGVALMMAGSLRAEGIGHPPPVAVK